MQSIVFSPGLLQHPCITKQISDAEKVCEKFIERKCRTKIITYYFQVHKIVREIDDMISPTTEIYQKLRTLPFHINIRRRYVEENMESYNRVQHANCYINRLCLLSFKFLSNKPRSLHYDSDRVAIVKKTDVSKIILRRILPQKYDASLIDEFAICAACSNWTAIENGLFCVSCRNELKISTTINGPIIIEKYQKIQILYCLIGYDITEHIKNMQIKEFYLVPLIVIP